MGVERERIRIGIIGMGRFGEYHMAVFQALDSVEVVGLCHRREDRLKELAQLFPGYPLYADYREMLAQEEMEAVSVVTSEHLHLEPVLASFESGKHVFLEKPIASSLEDADRMIEEAERRGLIFLVGHMLRFDPRYASLKERIEAGEVGQLATMYARRNYSRDYYDLYKRVYPSLVLGCHDIDMMLWYSDSPVVSVYAVEGRYLGGETPDTYWALLRFQNGVIGALEMSWLIPQGAPSPLDAQMQVLGTEGLLRIYDPAPNLVVTNDRGSNWVDVVAAPTLRGAMLGVLRDELVHFVECVKKEEQSTILCPRDARAALRIALAVAESAKSRQELRLGF